MRLRAVGGGQEHRTGYTGSEQVAVRVPTGGTICVIVRAPIGVVRVRTHIGRL
jgi:hypothetical protein